MSNRPGREPRAWEPLWCQELEQSLLDPSHGNSAQPLPSRRLSLASARRWQLNHWGCELESEARSTCSLPRRTFHLRCREICWYSASPAPVSSSVLPAETNWELLSREGSFVQLYLKDVQSLQASSLAASKGRNPALRKGCTILQAQQGLYKASPRRRWQLISVSSCTLSVSFNSSGIYLKHEK